MSDEKKGDEDEDLMSDFKDLFPEEDESSDNAAAGDGGEAVDELDALLDDFEQGFDERELGVEQAQDDNASEPEQTEASADESTGADEAPAEPEAEAPVLTEEVSESEAMQGAEAEMPAEPSDELTGEEESTADETPEEAPEAEAPGEAIGEGESEEADERDFELDQSDLDLAGETGPKTEEEPAVDAGQAAKSDEGSAASPEQGLDEVAAIAAGGAAAAGATQAASASSTTGNKLVWGLAGLVLVSVLLSAAALWVAFSQGRAPAGSVATVSNAADSRSTLNAVRTELRTLAARVNELAVIIEGPMSHLRESTEGKLADIEKRLASLEQRLDSSAPEVAVKADEPERPVQASAASAAKPPQAKAEASPGWAINLVSLSNEKDADAELKRLRQLGVEAEKQRARKGDEIWYRLRVAGFESYDEAKAFISKVEQRAGVKGAWVAKE